MTGPGRIFFDTAPIIYLVEHNREYFGKMVVFFQECFNSGRQMVTSVLTVEEYSVFPYRRGEHALLMQFMRLLSDAEMEIVEIDRRIADQAARIRAGYPGFKAMDALQLAAAIRTECELFVTNDKQLKQFDGIRVCTMEDLDVWCS